MTRIRAILHCVTRVGIGHFVRTREIARAVAERHDAYLVDDGAPVPDRAIHAGIHRISVPPVVREGGRLRSGRADVTLKETLIMRRERLVRAVRSIRPDIVLIEHFPFSKLEHRSEILPMIEAARAVNPGVLVVCSVRDLSPQPNYLSVGADYERQVLDTLHEWFDALVVHSDPHFVELGDSLKWVSSIRLPIAYTGYVAEPLSPSSVEADRPGAIGARTGQIIVTAGGRRDTALYDVSTSAWFELKRRQKIAGRSMSLIAPAGTDPGEIVDRRWLDADMGLSVEQFSPALVDRLRSADLSISQAGYNTCTNILVSGVRAIVVPNSNSADQVQRARLLSQHRLCRTLDPAFIDPLLLANAIENELESVQPLSHNIDLDGAQNTVELLEAWAFSRPRPLA